MSGAAETAALPFWVTEDAAAALPVYLCGAPALRPQQDEAPASFVARAFQPHLPDDGAPALITGYFEPEIAVREVADGAFRHPIYGLPPEPALNRAQIASGAAAGCELAWAADPVDVFFLQVQGSGRLRFPDGRILRVGFAGRNGLPYRSLGAEMAARGMIAPRKVTAQAIRAWLAAHPDRVEELLSTNPSYVYFRPVPGLSAADGPIGTAGVPLTAGRSIAVDPAHMPLGSLVAVETVVDGQPFRRLMVAQDTGSAIRGAQRADIFFGTGVAAGEVAGRMTAPGRLTVLVPREIR